MLETNGQSYRYRNGPQTWTRLSWPGEQENIGARVAGRTSRGGALAERTADGPWGIFHLFQSAAIETLESDVYRVEWRLQVGTREPVPVSFKLRAPDQAEVLTGSIFRQFRLRDRLFVGAGVDRPLAGAR
jgi:type VI secretion system protein ImpL